MSNIGGANEKEKYYVVYAFAMIKEKDLEFVKDLSGLQTIDLDRSYVLLKSGNKHKGFWKMPAVKHEHDTIGAAASDLQAAVDNLIQTAYNNNNYNPQDKIKTL